MNILKKIALSICLTLIFNVSKISAQTHVTDTQWGVVVKSDKTNSCQLSLKNNLNNNHFGSLTGQKSDGINKLSLRNSAYENILTVVDKRIGINDENPLGDLTIGNKFNIAVGGWTVLGQNWYWDGASKRLQDGSTAVIAFDDESNIRFNTGGFGSEDEVIADYTTKMIIDNDGRVGIGNNAQNLLKKSGNDITAYTLFVEKGILTEKVKVAVKSDDQWSDYVFEEDYDMLPINELKDYVTENKHLPNVPSAEEMVENGLDVAKMDAKLLEKIEEAYLYIIDINKAMEAMNEKVDALSTENEVLKTSLQSLNTSGK